jgi:ABC-type cobalamin transport system ATPase subunit
MLYYSSEEMYKKIIANSQYVHPDMKISFIKALNNGDVIQNVRVVSIILELVPHIYISDFLEALDVYENRITGLDIKDINLIRKIIFKYMKLGPDFYEQTGTLNDILEHSEEIELQRKLNDERYKESNKTLAI